jgi:GTP-binding protein EngB required for normal cell division
VDDPTTVRDADGIAVGARLNANQERWVTTTFVHLDTLLGAIDRLTMESISPFQRERPDLSPDEGRLLRALTAQLRRRLVEALDVLGLPHPQHTQSARWSVGTTLNFVNIALSELTPTSLRGYGALDPATGQLVTALAEQLRAIADRGRDILHEHDPGGLADRLAALPEPARSVLNAVERVSTTRGFVELRPLIAAAADRALATTFDIGVFGRVSAGKSSLINRLVGSAALPVGATPVTAVPIRIGRGDEVAVVRFQSGASQRIAVAEIARFVTEQGNPENVLDVAAVDIALPTVADGVRWLDTPGVGSLGRSGPAQAFAWLPRCDLGLVLIAAGTSISGEDMALVTGLLAAGITCQVLVSKADLLQPEDLTRVLDHLARELRAAVPQSVEIALYPVSSRAESADHLSLWLAASVEPLIADHRHSRRDALLQRLHRLLGAASAALAGRAEPRRGTLERVTRHQDAATAIRRVTDELAASVPTVLGDAAAKVQAAWQRNEDASAIVRALLVAHAGAALASVRAAVDGVRGATQSAPVDASTRLPPLFDASFLDALPDLHPPAVKLLARRAMAAGRVDALTDSLGTALSRYSVRLHAWGLRQLEDAGDGGLVALWSAVPDELQPLHDLIDREMSP